VTPPARSSRRARAGVGALLLTPGAGSDRNHASLVAIEHAVAPLPVARVDFPYRRAGRRAPDRAEKLIACVVEEAAALAVAADVTPDRIVLGGRSMGGRMCSMAVAEGLPAAGLVLISYPLHPPGKPEKLRTAHLPQLAVPCLFVSGERDTFGTPDELHAATATIPGPVTHVWLPGKGHDLKGANDTIVAAVVDWLATLTR
jgi:predicted alpha/beta-hydrolase family hydrolase